MSTYILICIHVYINMYTVYYTYIINYNYYSNTSILSRSCAATVCQARSIEAGLISQSEASCFCMKPLSMKMVCTTGHDTSNIQVFRRTSSGVLLG